MADISNFTSVLEISFAINTLVYYFDVKPKQKIADSLVLDNFDEIFQKLKEEGFDGLDSEYFREGLIKYNTKLDKILSSVVLSNSLLSLFLLIWVGFNSSLCFPWFVVAVAIFILFVPVAVLYPIAVKYRKNYSIFVIKRLAKLSVNR